MYREEIKRIKQATEEYPFCFIVIKIEENFKI